MTKNRQSVVVASTRTFRARVVDALRADLVRALAVWTFAASLLSGCGGGGNSAPAPDALPLGSIGQHPNANPSAPTFFIAEDDSEGDASQLRLLDSYWGRLVEVYDLDGSTPVFSDFVIDDQILGDGTTYALERDALTDVERVRILFQQDTPEFYAAVLGLEAGMQVLLRKGVSPAELPPFTAVARNAALVLAFNDLLDPETIDAQTVRLSIGYPPTQPFEARVMPDPSHGNLAGGRFYSTRVIVDLSVSEFEAQSSGLQLNALGLPSASSVTLPNALVRIPTRAEAASQQLEVLRSASGRAVSFTDNGPTDPLAPSLDVLRAFRSGGATLITGDANNGFLIDNSAPLLIGRQSVALLNSLHFALGPDQPATLRFQTAACAFTPQVGDLLEINGVRMRVVGAAASAPINGVVGPVLVRPLCATCEAPSIPVNTTNPPLGSLRAPYRAQAGSGADFPACFIEILPAPLAPPAAGIAVGATFSLSFSEPLDPTTVRPFDSFVLRHDNNAPSASPLYQSVVGGIARAPDSRRFTFQPSVPLRRVSPGGQADRYRLELSAGEFPVRDLAGNALANALPTVALSLHTQGPQVDSGSIRLRFDSADEDVDGAPEVRGQLLYDIARQALKPRALQRFSAVVDPTVPTVAAMRDRPDLNIQTPLSNNGSRMMRAWRYCDVGGMGLRDESTHNLDLEGLWWQPFGDAVQTDNFAQFQIGVAHSRYLPDENVELGLPQHPDSGLVQAFASNLLDPISDPLTVLAPRARGYSVNPIDVGLSTSGNVIAPFPINRDMPQSEFTYWTWRDTAKTAVGAPLGVGADPARVATILGAAANKGFYPVDQVPTIGLPLLTEIRTYPDSLATGQNGFRIAIALNSSARPYFRVFATGSVSPSTGIQTPVDPDTTPLATGGINPNTGATLWWGDNTMYYGQADFVVRVSRMHTVWFDALNSATRFVDALVEPGPENLPSGTQLIVAYRGALGFTPAPPAGQSPQSDARNFDSYGNLYTGAQLSDVFPPAGAGVFATSPLFHPAGSGATWSSSANQLDGARYIQARVTFLSSAASGLSPELSGLGFAYLR